MPQDTTVALTLADGRTLSGHAFLKDHRMTSNASGSHADYTYVGTGALDGAEDFEFS
jgi:hypothetical protein